MEAGRERGDIVANSVTCVGEHCYIEGNVKCAELQMHGGKIKGNIEADTKAVVNGAIEGNITCKEDVFGEHAAVIGEYIRCEVLTVEPGARIAAKIEMAKTGDKEEREAEKPPVHYGVPVTDADKPGDKNYPKIEKHMDKPKSDDNKAKH